MNNRAQIIIGAENQAGAGINKAKKDLRELGSAGEKAGSRTKKSFREATVSSNSLSGSVSKLYASMAGLAALVGAGAIARGFLETAAAMERTRLMLEGLEGSANKAEASVGWLLEFATTAPYQLSTLSDTFVKLRVAGLDPTAGSMQALVDAVAAFGGSNEQLQRASVAIMQMAGKGVISMEELRQQLGEAVPDAIHVMAHEMGMTVRDLVDMVSKGNLDATTGLTALFEGWAKKHKGAAETFANSMSGLWNQIKLQYELFKNDMMSSGDSFITIKAALKTTLDLIKRWREDGSIVEWSEYVVKALGVVVEGVHLVGKAFLGWKLIWEGLKVAWDATVAGIYASVAWLADKMGILLEKIAGIQEFFTLDEAADKTRIAAASMKGWADETSRAADILIDDIATKGVEGVEDAVAAIIDLDQKTAQLKGAFHDNVKAMKAQAEAAKAAGSAVAEGTEKAVEALEKLDPKLATAYDKLHDFLAIHSQADDAARKIAALNIEYGHMADQLSKMQDAGLEVIEMSEQLEQWYAQSMDEITKKTETTTDKIYDTWVHAYERLQDITADWIYDMKVDFDSIVDLFKRSVAEMISAWIWGQQSMQFASGGGGGGFSLGGMFGGMFGGGSPGVPQPGSANFIGPVQAGAQGINTAYSLSGAYGAYTSAGGGWAGMKAGTSSFFGGGSSIMPYVAAAVVAYDTISTGLSSAKANRESPFASSWERGGAAQVLNESMMRLSYPAMGGAVSKVGSLIGSSFLKSLSFLGPLGGIVGAFGFDPLGIGKTFNKWFGNKKRSGLYGTYEVDEYSPETGWGAPDEPEWSEKRKGYKFKPAAESMVETGLNLMNALDSMFKDLLGSFGENWTNLFTTKMMEMSTLSFDFGINAEDKGEFQEGWRKSWESLTKGLIDPIVDIGTDLLSQALDGTVADATAWNYFSDKMRDYLKTGLEDSLAGLKIDWSTVTDQESFEAAIEQMGLAAEEIAAIMEYFSTVGAILDHITTAIDLHGFSGSVKSAILELDSINAEFVTLRDTLISLGVDLEKYPDLLIAYNLAVQDWIEKAFVGAISYASTSQGWQAMAPQAASSTDVWLGQYQHIQDLSGAYDGTTASAIELSDALGILSGLSHDLAAELQNAIDSIHQSYSSAIESMYLETLSDQQQYDYYRDQVSQFYADLPGLTDAADIQQYTQDILQYSQAAYAMMSDEQKKQYFGDYQAFLQGVETDSTDRINIIGDAMDDANKVLTDKVIPALADAAADIKDAAELISSGGADVASGGTDIVAAANTPINFSVNLESGEVG